MGLACRIHGPNGSFLALRWGESALLGVPKRRVLLRTDMIVACRVRTFLMLVLACLGMVAILQPLRAQRVASQDTAVMQKRLQTAFVEGDARALLETASERLAVSLFGARSFYSRAQAAYVLRDFFKEYPPQRFQVRTESHTPTNYLLVGRYWHARTQQPLRVYLHLRYRDQWGLEEVRIE